MMCCVCLGTLHFVCVHGLENATERSKQVSRSTTPTADVYEIKIVSTFSQRLLNFFQTSSQQVGEKTKRI